MKFGVLGGGRGCGDTPGYPNPISLCRGGQQGTLSPPWVVQFLSYSYTGFPGRSEHGGTLQSPAVLVGNCEMKWGQRTVLQGLVLA